MKVHRVGFAALLAFPLPALGEGTDVFHSPTAGFTVTRPSGWVYLSIAHLEANREDVRLKDTDLQQAIKKQANAPLVAFTRHPEPYADLNPTVQVVLRPLGELSGRSPTQLLELAMGALKNAFADFEVVTPIQETKVSGLPAASLTAKYTIGNAAGAEFPVLSRLWIVPRGAFMFQIGMSGPQTGPQVSEAEFSAVLASIVIDH